MYITYNSDPLFGGYHFLYIEKLTKKLRYKIVLKTVINVSSYRKTNRHI